jgi:DNA-binding CsgD family transcriptional regulator
MSIRWRPMRPRDVPDCVEIVAAHPVLAQRYGLALHDLQGVWLGLLGHEAFRAFVFEEIHNGAPRIFGAGVSVFVSGEFLGKLKTPPFVWVGPKLTNQEASGPSPLLSDREVREANANRGLDMVVWEAIVRPEDFLRFEVNVAVVSAFVEVHRGFLMREVLGQPIVIEQLLATLHGGALFLNSEGRYIDSLDVSREKAVAEPHFYGITREIALSRAGTWLGSLFIYEPPRLGFRPSEQRLLLTALRGGTDEELAQELGISLSAVKKTWLLIYERASMQLRDYCTNHDGPNGATERGKEKKQRLLNYLREHPEELRPATP